jgi:hypothetical protein
LDDNPGAILLLRAEDTFFEMIGGDDNGLDVVLVIVLVPDVSDGRDGGDASGLIAASPSTVVVVGNGVLVVVVVLVVAGVTAGDWD